MTGEVEESKLVRNSTAQENDAIVLTKPLGTGIISTAIKQDNSMARLAITSLKFIFDWVPEPVCQTTNGKWASSLPLRTSSAAFFIGPANFESNLPLELFTDAAAFLTIPYARIKSLWNFSPPILKLFKDLCVWAPYSRL